MNSWVWVARAISAANANSTDLVESVDVLISDHYWAEFTTPQGEVVQHLSLKEFIEEPPNRGLGMRVETFLDLLTDTNMPELASRVRVAVLESLPPANPNGTNRFSLGDTKATSDENNAGYVVSRLKRDDSELAQQVVNGEITANAAAVKAGIRHKYARIRTDDVTRAVTKLLEVYELDEVLSTLRSVK